MTYNAQGIGKSGARKRLVEEVVKIADKHHHNVFDAEEAAARLAKAVLDYKKETSK